jgi:four helix bundle protein
MSDAKRSTFGFRDLIVWKKSVEFAETVIGLIDRMETPRKHYRLIEQLEAAATSVAMNIAEGKGRQTVKEFNQFLYIARGSLFEVVTLLIVFMQVGWVENRELQRVESLAEEIAKMINSLIKSMRASEHTGR